MFVISRSFAQKVTLHRFGFGTKAKTNAQWRCKPPPTHMSFDHGVALWPVVWGMFWRATFFCCFHLLVDSHPLMPAFSHAAGKHSGMHGKQLSTLGEIRFLEQRLSKHRNLTQGLPTHARTCMHIWAQRPLP